MVQRALHPVIHSNARDLFFLRIDCNISVSLRKSLRQMASRRYTLGIEDCVQAPRRRLFHFEPLYQRSGTLGSPLFSVACALLFLTVEQAIHYQALPDSLKNIGGVPQSFPFWDRRRQNRASVVALRLLAFAAGLGTAALTIPSPVADRGPAEIAPRGPELHHFEEHRFSLAVKKRSIPNFRRISRNKGIANDVYQVTRTDLQENDR